jgi:uncharacterized protein YndB with AHSA1/START domain
MHSFELKIVIKGVPSRVFDTLTVPKLITKWDTCAWVQNDMHLGGKLRKRDEEGQLTEGEIVQYDPPECFGYTWPVPVDADEPEQGSFLTRMEFRIEGAAGGSMLMLKVEGFPSEELCEREQNSWGGWLLEQIRKVAEGGKG